MPDAKEVYDAVRKSMEADIDAATIDMMVYGRSILCITPDGITRVPPEDWEKLALDFPKNT